MSNPSEEPRAFRPAAGASDETSAPVLRPVQAARPFRVAPRDPTLAELAWTLAERRWTIAVIAVAALAAGVAYLFLAPPVFESSVLVQVEGRARPAAPENVVQLFDTAPPAEAEMRILRSRTLLDAVVGELGLDIEAGPRQVPLLGGALARRWKGEAPAPAPFGQLASFGWGGERIQVKQLEVPDALVGEPLALVALEGGQYELRTGDVVVTGRVGAPAVAGDGDRAVRVLVTDLRARPNTAFEVRKLRRVDLIDRLQKELRVTEQGKPGGLIEVSVTGPDPTRIARILETLAATYVRQSLERTSAEAANSLRVFEDRLSARKSDLDGAEAALSRFYRRNGGVNLSLDARRLVEQIGVVDRAVTEAELADTDLATKHTARFPEGSSPAERAAKLRVQREQIEGQIAALPAIELEYARLTRQVAMATDRYLHVLGRVEELRAAKSGWMGNARVLEHAVERREPVSPRKGLVLALAALLGLGGGIALVLVGSAFDEGVRDPGEIEARTGLPVFATIPRSPTQRGIGRRSRRARLDVLSVVDPSDAAVEELRALRTGVQFALARATNNIIAIGSPAPAAGKSFVAVNLAHLLASADARVLVVDGDLRRAILHRYLGREVQPGLSDFLCGDATLATAIHRTDNPDVDLLPAGRRVTNPAELLSGAPFARLLDQVRERYRLIIVDTPPILSVTDGSLVGRHAGINILVVRAGEQTAREIDLALKRLVRNGVSVRGAVLNDIRPTLGRYGKSGRYRRYDTRST